MKSLCAVQGLARISTRKEDRETHCGVLRGASRCNRRQPDNVENFEEILIQRQHIASSISVSAPVVHVIDKAHLVFYKDSGICKCILLR